ncbi:hypothetical protein KKH82_04600 [Patescibacteria group bacterium]|nr:hypothetical protein [Patescibacteria group bacterium]
MDFSMVIAQLRSSFVKFPVDKKIIDGNLYSFEVINYETNLTGLLQNISNYDIINIQGKTIKVSDVAQVYIGYKNQDKKSFIVTDVNSLEGRNALAFHVKKSPGYSLGPLVEAVKEVTLEYQKAHPNIEFIETLSQEESIKKTYGTFIQNFWQTGLLVFFVILLFL